MDFARRLQINSLYEAGNIFEESIPGIECEICEEELTLTTSVRDEEVVSHHFSCSKDDLDGVMTGYQIDLKGRSKELQIIRDAFIDHLPLPENYAGSVRDIPIVLVAGLLPGAQAYKEGVVTINLGLFVYMDTMILPSIMLMNAGRIFDQNLEGRVNDDSEEFKQALLATGVCASQCSTLNLVDGYSRSLALIKSLLSRMDEKEGFELLETLSGYRYRFIIFVVFHEFSHLVLRHHDVPCALLLKLPEGTDSVFQQELEADLWAVSGLASFCKIHGLDVLPITCQVIAVFSIMCLSETLITDTFEARIRLGYPTLSVRAISMLKVVCGEEWMSSPEALNLITGLDLIQKLAPTLFE